MDDCDEYKAGFCTKTEFFIEGKTEPCTHQHTTSTSFKLNPLPTYTQIIQEIEEKIESNLFFLELKSSSYSKMEIIDKIKEFIDRCDNTLLIKRFIKAYGRCLRNINNNEHIDIGVCNICAAFYSLDDECKHIFHNKYKILREVRDKLSKENFNVK